MQHSQKQSSVHRAGAAAGAQPGTSHTAAEVWPVLPCGAGGGRGMALLTALTCPLEVWVRFFLFFREADSKHCSDAVKFQQNA